jgi:hypothetical protein
MITVNWSSRVIFVPQSDLTPVSGALYELDVDVLRLALKDIEDAADGMSFPDTHRHNTQVTLSGVTYARTFEVINGYTVEFEDGQYAVRLVGANHNIADVKVANQVSLIIGNSAGLITVATGGSTGPTAAEVATAVWTRAIESGLTAEQLQRLMLSVLAGKASGGGSSPITFRDVADTKDRVVLTVDSNGNRSAVVRDGI